MGDLWPQLALSGTGIGALVAVIRWITHRTRDPETSQPPRLLRFVRWCFRVVTILKQLGLKDEAEQRSIIKTNQLRGNLKWADEMIERLQINQQRLTDELIAKDQEIARLRSERAASNGSPTGRTESGGETTPRRKRRAPPSAK